GRRERDPAEDGGAAGGLAEAGRDPVLAGDRASAGVRTRRRGIGVRRRGSRRGRGLRGDRRGGGRGEAVTDEPRTEEVEEQEPVEVEVDPLAAATRERDEYLDSLQRLKA